MDPDNPVVKLCAQGMHAEAQGRMEEAHRLFEQAWDARQDDFEGCVAAHFLARHQEDPQEMLRWNREALALAEAAGDERVHGFYPSLYLNLGYSHEVLGELDAARRLYVLAAARLDDLPAGPYADTIRSGIERGRARIEAALSTARSAPRSPGR